MTTGPAAEDEHRRRLRAGRSVTRAALTRPPRDAATNRSNTASASSGPGAPSGWYWTVSIGCSRWRSPSTEPSLRLTLADPEAGRRRQRRRRRPGPRGSGRSPGRSPSSRSWTGWFAPWWPNRSRRVSAPAARADDLVAEADAEQRPAVVDDRPRQRDRAVEARRIARARATGSRRRCRPARTSAAVAVCGRTRTRAPRRRMRADDVRLQAEVDDRRRAGRRRRSPDRR